MLTLYSSPENRLISSGLLSVYSHFGKGTNRDDHAPHNAGTRARVILEHNLVDGWTAVGLSSWGFAPFFKDGDDHHFKRLQYIGLATTATARSWWANNIRCSIPWSASSPITSGSAARPPRAGQLQRQRR